MIFSQSYRKKRTSPAGNIRFLFVYHPEAGYLCINGRTVRAEFPGFLPYASR